MRAGIHTLTAYSTHADQRMLVDWVQFIIYIDDPLTLQSCHPSGHLVLPALVCYTMNIEARYPINKKKLLESLTEKRCASILDNAKELREWILLKL